MDARATPSWQGAGKDPLLRYRNREVRPTDLELLRSTIADCGTRKEVYLRVCEAWSWRQANGAPSIVACQDLLLRLEERGYLQLPASRKASGRGPSRRRLLRIPLMPITRSGPSRSPSERSGAGHVGSSRHSPKRSRAARSICRTSTGFAVLGVWPRRRRQRVGRAGVGRAGLTGGGAQFAPPPRRYLGDGSAWCFDQGCRESRSLRIASRSRVRSERRVRRFREAQGATGAHHREQGAALLGRVKGFLARLGGCAALDAPCAARRGSSRAMGEGCLRRGLRSQDEVFLGRLPSHRRAVPAACA
jgi:hypothetical protein